MPCQAGLYCNDARHEANKTYVNDAWVMTFADTGWATGTARAQRAAERLNAIFTDWAFEPYRDLDFITPSYQLSLNGGYCVVCPRVVYNDAQVGGKTYFKTSGCGPCNLEGRGGAGICGGSALCLPENLYHLDNTSDDLSAAQTLVTPVAIEDEALHGMKRWQIALEFANKIRGAVVGGYNGDALGRQIQQLDPAIPSSPSGLPVFSGEGAYYGNPNAPYYQGQSSGNPNNICCARTANGDIFHPLDLTIALPSAVFSQYQNQWVQVCYAGQPCIAARVTDISPGTADLAYGGLAIPLGFPGSGQIDVYTLA